MEDYIDMAQDQQWLGYGKNRKGAKIIKIFLTPILTCLFPTWYSPLRIEHSWRLNWSKWTHILFPNPFCGSNTQFQRNTRDLTVSFEASRLVLSYFSPVQCVIPTCSRLLSTEWTAAGLSHQWLCPPSYWCWFWLSQSCWWISAWIAG